MFGCEIFMLSLRIKKLAFALSHTKCWPALRLGVAPSIEHLSVLKKLAFDGVIDVGANRGQFALACRICQPQIPVAAFEPIPQEAAVFRSIHDEQGVVLTEMALGREVGQATLHLSNSADSSSLLPIGDRQTEIFPSTRQVGVIDVAVNTLDNYAALWQGRTKQLLKIDVQGYELEVLAGARRTLTSCRYVYCECSEVELYSGQALRSDVSQFLAEHHFAEHSRHNSRFESGQLIQADYLFVRSADKHASRATND